MVSRALSGTLEVRLALKSVIWKQCLTSVTEILMVRMQGDFAKPPEKRLNYKNSVHGLYRVRTTLLTMRLSD